ncbi:MAG TPA: relaxase domain-containing protein, partial [Nakamurella sp.]
MTATLHKLTAGDGYTYLTRQVAAGDVTARGRGSLGAYYEQRGESPGVWLGSGLSSLEAGPRAGDPVSEAQMVA